MTINPNKQVPGGADNVNEEFFFALVRHQIFLLRLSGSVRNAIVDVLNANEAELAAKIRSGLTGSEKGLTPAMLRKVKRLQAIIKKLRTRTISQVTEKWVQELIDLSIAEAASVDGMLKTVSPVLLDTVLPPVATLKALVDSQPFEGRVLKEWASKLAADDIARINAQIMAGVVQSESPRDIARRIIGTAALKGSDGVTQITRNNAFAITRTAVNSIGNAARREYFKANADLFEEELYVATLDARTTAVCRQYDGDRFPVGEGPIPPLHWNCRSLRTAIIDGEIIGKRPAKPVTERALVREFVRQNGLDGRITRRTQLPRGFKGRYDQFAQRRTRELVGQVDGKINYEQFLRKQSIEFQDEVLGPTKAILFRKGELTLDKFVNRAGDELTLSQLARLERDAFIKAGLDPEDYL